MIRGIPQLVAATIALVAPTHAPANCFPPKPFSQIGLQFSQYVFLPAEAEATPTSVIGRFWQPGFRVSTNEGTCDETRWLPRCFDFPVEHDGPVYYIDGILGDMPCLAGCPNSEMIVLLQDRIPGRGGIFAAGRVNEFPGSVPRYDFSRIEKDWLLIPIPQPQVIVSEVEESTLRLGMHFADPVFGYFGLEGATPTETITAIHVFTFEGLIPPLDRSQWTHLARFPYEGGVTTGSTNIFSACPGTEGMTRFVASALELDGEVLTDYVSAGTPVSCTQQSPSGAGRLPESGNGALTIARSAQGDLTLAWGTACAPVNPTYEVYEGVMGDWDDSLPVTCAVSDQTLTFPEPPHDAYYLVVPFAYRVIPPIVAGSYGVRTGGAERPPSVHACRPQNIVPCP